MLWGGAMLGLAEGPNTMLLLATCGWLVIGCATAWMVGCATELGKPLQNYVTYDPLPPAL